MYPYTYKIYMNLSGNFRRKLLYQCSSSISWASKVFENSNLGFKIRRPVFDHRIHQIRLESTLVATTEFASSEILNERRKRYRLSFLWKMSTQLAKPYTIYVIPEDSDAERHFQMFIRYTVRSPNFETTNDSNQFMLSFNRDYDGVLKDTLSRIRMKLVSIHERTSGTKKRKGKADLLGITTEEESKWNLRVLTADGSRLDENSSNEVAFIKDGKQLAINDETYVIFSPTPSITKLEVDLIPMVGYPLMASINCSKDSSPEDCQYFWFLRNETVSDKLSHKSSNAFRISCDHDNKTGAVNIREIVGFTLKCTDRVYVPEEQDVGKEICFVVTPRNKQGLYGLPRIWIPNEKSKQSEMFKKGVVVNASAPMVCTERQQLCSEWAPSNTFRCMSYNILADLYLNLALPDEQLYFPYCSKKYQDRAYRYPILLKEISGYHADLCCLQEVDTRNYRRYLSPYLNSLNWRGIFTRKGGVVNEGSAIFYRPEKFELLQSNDEILSDLLSKDSEEFADLAMVAKQNEQIWNTFLTRPAIVQLAVFRCLTVPNSFICVGNTHLHFKPHHSYIRLLQAATGYRHLLNVADKVQEQNPNATIAVMFCGDFNSRKETGVYEMFEKGSIDSDHDDWQPRARDHESDDEMEQSENSQPIIVQGIDLRFSKPLKNACPSIEYTTKTDKFRGLLDYIFVSDELRTERVIPMPNDSLISKYVGLPSPICPSDHLPVVCELKFK